MKFLTISNEHRLRLEVQKLSAKNSESQHIINATLLEKQKEIQVLTQLNSYNTDAISGLSDKISLLTAEIEKLKKA